MAFPKNMMRAQKIDVSHLDWPKHCEELARRRMTHLPPHSKEKGFTPEDDQGEDAMSLRTKIAQWLAPEVFRERDYLRQDVVTWEGYASRWSVKAMRRKIALEKIAAQRTRGCNATVRRICDLAEAELNWREDHSPLPSSLPEREQA